MHIINQPNELIVQLLGSIWDMDGTVLDTLAHNYDWLKWAYDKYSTRSTPFPEYSQEWQEEYNRIYGEEGLEGIYTKVIYADWHKHEKEIWNDFNEYNEKNPTKTIVVDGTDIADVLREIKKRGEMSLQRTSEHILAINTTKSYKSIASSLKANGIHFFNHRATYDSIIQLLANGVMKKKDVTTNDIEELRKLLPKELTKWLEKPNSFSSRVVLDRMGLEYNTVFALEDTASGIQAYKPVFLPKGSRNIYVAGVTWGFDKDPYKLIKAGADVIFEHPKEIITFMKMNDAFL